MKRAYAVNKRLRKMIIESDKKPTAIADKAGLRRDVFSRVLNCKRPIYADEIPFICKALGVSPSDLFSEEPKEIKT
ncbi:XRE family transcriptional regulator [Anaerotruncus sp. AF02-27]|uniref:helix-turn-helix domain-containing protein n=1 Tax=Anaerotruncus TaxID=244127 RepID=UPI000E520769|nr:MULTISPECIES: helix-turn-helix transcriptional regulator [Anaerotruncus]RGX57039.1 XRE family transcriptional regulator [Anaerotruncus sp. AF02-27]